MQDSQCVRANRCVFVCVCVRARSLGGYMCQRLTSRAPSPAGHKAEVDTALVTRD